MIRIINGKTGQYHPEDDDWGYSNLGAYSVISSGEGWELWEVELSQMVGHYNHGRIEGTVQQYVEYVYISLYPGYSSYYEQMLDVAPLPLIKQLAGLMVRNLVYPPLDEIDNDTSADTAAKSYTET